jgi:hypothetical protein
MLGHSESAVWLRIQALEERSCRSMFRSARVSFQPESPHSVRRARPPMSMFSDQTMISTAAGSSRLTVIVSLANTPAELLQVQLVNCALDCRKKGAGGTRE